MNNIKVVTLCGSTKFIATFKEIEKELTKKGMAVLSPLFFEDSEEGNKTIKEKGLLGQIHLKKIERSDEIFVIDVDGYLGESTKKEISYAQLKGKKVSYYSKNKHI